MNKKIFIENNYITSSNIKNKKTFLVLSDMHYQVHSDKVLYGIIIKYLRENIPDYVIMPGDIFDNDKFLENIESKKFFDKFIRSLAEISPVVMIPGNHDACIFDVKTFFNKKFSYNKNTMNYLENLNRINNIYFLNNMQVSINDVTFFGINPSYETYLKYNDRKTNDLFINDYLRCNFKLNKDEYNILLSHNPMPLFNDYVVKSLNDFSLYDLSISGHFHDGYMPKFLDKFFINTNVGVFTVPFIPFYPGVECRGLHDFGRGNAFISQGFEKFSDFVLFNMIDKYIDHDIERLIVSNKINKNNLQKKKY